MDFRIRGNSRIYILTGIIVSVLLLSCNKSQFKWKTRKSNTREVIAECDSLLCIEGISKNPEYGFTPDRPISLGVKDVSLALTYPDKYLKSIAGPNGEDVTYKRIKSCCPFKTANNKEARLQNLGVLEVYSIYYHGLQSPLMLYLNFFDQGEVLAPKGFIIKKTKSK